MKKRKRNPRPDPEYIGCFSEKDPPKGKEDGDTCVVKSRYTEGAWEMWCWGFTGLPRKPVDWIYCGEGPKDMMIKEAKNAVSF